MAVIDETRARVFNRFDFVVICVAIFFATLSFLGRWQGLTPFVDLEPDAKNIASFVAARNNPSLFEKDFLLSQIQNFNVYWTIHFPVLEFLNSLTGDYGTAFLVLYPVHIVFQLVGFYILGRVLFKHRGYAFIFMILTTIPIAINLGEAGGIFKDAIPRFTFQVLLPYILTLAVLWHNRPNRWFIVMALVGLLVYVHSVSTPAWGFAIWLGYWVVLPRDWSWIRRVGFMFALGAVFLLVIAPFASHYLGNFEHGTTIAYEQIMEIARYRFLPGFLDIQFALYAYWSLVGQLMLLGMLGIFTTLLIRQNRGLVLMICLWTIGILFVSIIIPLIDHSVAAANQRFPLQIDLIRGLRYTIMLAWVFAVWMFQSMQAYWHERPYRLVAPALLIILTTVVSIRTLPLMSISKLFACMAEGKIICHDDQLENYADVMTYIRDEIPADALIAGGELPVRYIGLHPLAYDYKDGGILAYGNHQRLLEWYDIDRAYKTINAIADLTARTEQLIGHAHSIRGDYLVLEYPLTDAIEAVVIAQDSEVVYRNDFYIVINLAPQKP